MVNGQDITSKLLAKDQRRILVSLTVTDEAGVKSDTCTLVVDNRAPGFKAPATGELMEVWMGYEPAPQYMGKFRIDEWEKSGPPNILTITAKSAELTTAIKETKHKPWDNTTLGNIVQTIAEAHGLSSVMTGDLASRPVEHIDQHGESDLAFLSRLAKRNGAMFKLADGKVIFVKRGTKLPSGKGKSAITLKPDSNVVNWSMRMSVRGEHKSVKATWHDHDKGKRKSVTAGSGHPVHRDKRVYRTEAEARAAAEGQLADFKRGKADGSVDLVGNTGLFAETLVTLSGFDEDVDGTYNAKSVTHTFDSSGYRTSVALEAGEDSEADSSE